MKKLLLALSTSVACIVAQAQCTDLFFSEYLEGSSNNKALEIYNPTAASVNLTDYRIYRFNNGSSLATDSLLMQGTLAPGAVFVAANPSAIASITGVADTLHTITFFNGDDVLLLKNMVSGDTLDIIGDLGVDPGVNWPVSTGATSEFTLVRMIGIQQGTTNWTIGATEWDAYPQNTDIYLGTHSMTPCCAPVNATILTQANISCNGNADGNAVADGSGGASFTFLWSNGASTAAITNLSGGVYTCTVTNECGNFDTANVNIIEPTTLQSMVVPLQNVSCNGAADGSAIGTVFGGTPSYTISWAPDTSSSTLNTALAAGTYTMTATDANGCTTSSTVTITEPAPIGVSLNLSLGDTVCQNAGMLNLGGESPTGGNWSGSGVTANQFDPAALSLGYNLIFYSYTDSNNCTESATDSVFVDLCSSVGQVNTEIDFEIFPNPASSTISIRSSAIPAGALMEIYDVSGRMTTSLLSKEQLTIVDIATLDKGLYFVRIKLNERILIHSFIKN